MSHLLQHLLWGIGVRIRKRHDERETRETMTTHELWKACSCPTRPYKVSARVPKASRSLTNASLAESGRSGFSNGPGHASAVTAGNASSQRIPASSNGPSQASAVITGNASSQRVPQGVDGDNLPVNEFRIDSATFGSAIQQVDTVISTHVMVSAVGDCWTSHSEPKPITSVLWLGGLWMWFKSCFWGIVASTCPPFSIEPTLYPTRILFHVCYISHVLRNPKISEIPPP